ncbi:Thiolase, N-terminal domain-containing protein [Dipodascopsis uninucleata]
MLNQTIFLRNSAKKAVFNSSSSRTFHSSSARRLSGKDVFIVSAARTPVGKFNGALKSVKAPQLGSIAIKAAIDKAGIEDLSMISDVYMGQVLQAGCGQSPARQAAIMAGLPVSTDATTVNKVCASGIKAVMFATQNIQTGMSELMVAGGMESMSNVPFYLSRNIQYGHQKVLDGIIKDGLWDVYDDIHMGNCGENTAKNFSLTREMQDTYALESYKRSIAAIDRGAFSKEIVPVEVKSRGKTIMVTEDEEPKSANLEKLTSLRPAFDAEGTITAGNASPLNDGASAVVLASENMIDRYDLVRPLAQVISYADAATAPIDFTIAPSLSIPLALKRAGLRIQDIARFEINEAFSVVALANQHILGLDPEKVNVNGGAVALGHAIGNSGCRILISLVYSLQEGQYGVAAICNGGGASSAMVIQRL